MLMEEEGVADWLEICERILYAEFNRSNFYEALGELAPDIHSAGTGYLYSEEDAKTGRIIYQCRHPRACWVAENIHGEVDTIFEDVHMTRRAAAKRFGDNYPKERQEEAEKRPFESIIIKHAVFPADERIRALGLRPVAAEMPFDSVWFDPKGQTILDAGGYWEFPYQVSRYKKNAGEAYGRAPGQDALGDAMGANQMSRSRIALGNLIADPTLVVPEVLRGNDDILPGGRIYTKKDTQRVEPLGIGANYPITVDNEERQDRIIEEHFNVPIYLMLQAAEKQMTAREVIERVGEKAAVLGYISGRYQNEVLQPAIRRTFNILYRAGKLPPAPPAVKEQASQAGLEIEFLSFFAQVQKKYYQSAGIAASMDYAAGMAQLFGPDVLDNIDKDAFFREGMEAGGAPARTINEKSQVGKIRAARAQAQQQAIAQAQQMQSQEMLMKNIDLGKKPEDGSPLAAAGQYGANPLEAAL